MLDYSVLVSVIRRGKASKVLATLKHEGASGGTIVYGEGTADSEILEMFDYHYVKKEVLFSVIDRLKEKEILKMLDEKFHFNKANHGIAFTIPLNEVITNKNSELRNNEKENTKMDYEVVFVVVDNHRGDDVVSIANNYGAKGATIIHGRGSGIHEKGSIFNITIEPEKEIVMLLLKDDMHQKVIQGLSDELKIDEPGNGIIFSAGVTNALGLVE